MSDSNRGALAKIGRLVLLWGLLGALTVAASALTVGWGLSVRAVDQQTYPIPSRECAADKSCEQKAVQIAARQAAIDDTAAMFALYQLALSVAGFVGLGLTFFYAHKAWKEAQRSADIIQSGRKFLYLWGWVRYFDVFDTAEKDEHITRFCCQMVPGGDPVAFNPLANPPDGIKWDHISHATGNCADDECKDHG